MSGVKVLEVIFIARYYRGYIVPEARYILVNNTLETGLLLGRCSGRSICCIVPGNDRQLKGGAFSFILKICYFCLE